MRYKCRLHRKGDAMNKLLMLLILVMLSQLLIADINLEFQISDNNSQVRFSGENAIINSQSNIYAVYCRKEGNSGILELAIANGYAAPFTRYTLDTLYTETPANIENVLPVIKERNSVELMILYNKLNRNNCLVLHKAIFNTTQNTFTVSELTDEITSAPVVSKDSNDMYVYYSTSFREKPYEYCYFIDTMRSVMPEQNPVRLYSFTKLFGKVHSNDNVELNPASMPFFTDTVSACNRILCGHQPAPLDNQNFFEKGGREFVKRKNLPQTATDLRSIASTPFDSTAEIVYVKINGSTYQSMYANITETQLQIPVYSWFPADDDQARNIIANGGNWYEDAHVIWTNTVTKYDTVWTQGPSGTCENNQFWLNTTLWIEGTVSGMQVWGSSKDVYITGDILYTDTPQGQNPDGYNTSTEDYTDPVNTNDYFGLVTEGNIYLKYKHRDPFLNGLLRDDNCYDLHMYGSYAAIGFGETQNAPYRWHNTSSISFEYFCSHHGLKDFQSISPYTLNDTLFSDVIYNRYIVADPATVPDSLRIYCLNNPTSYITFPDNPNTLSPRILNPAYHNSYPNDNVINTPPMLTFDFPGFNPVGPENIYEICHERGDLYIYGSVITRRVGFFRSDGDSDYRHYRAVWDLKNHKYGTDTNMAGYEYRWMFHDKRLDDFYLPGFPLVNNISFERISLSDDSLDIKSDVTETTQSYISKNCFFVEDDTLKVFISQRDIDDSPISMFDVYSSSNNNEMQYNILTSNTSDMLLTDVKLYNGIIYLMFFDSFSSESAIYQHDVTGNTLTEHTQFTSGFESVNMDFLFDDQVAIAVPEIGNNNRIVFYSEAFPNSHFFDWDPSFIDDNSTNPVSEIYFDTFGNDNIFACILTDEGNGWGKIWVGNGSYSITGTDEEVIPSNDFNISNYPNPFNPETNISYSIPEDANVEISIYNIKGQKVKTLLNEQVLKGNHNVIWNGVDDNNRSVGSGVYFYKLKADNKTISVNKCVLIK